jgi:ATP-dependent DNA helicase RecQ
MTTCNILSDWKLAPADVPALPAQVRTSLIGFLLRWEHYEAAMCCCQELLATHGHLVSVYDDLARAFLGLNQARQALEITQRRQALKVSSSSQVLEARACLSMGDLAAAERIGSELVTEHPDLLLTWDLQAEISLAAGNLEAAQTALQQREALQPKAAASALGWARYWLAQGEMDKALLWARTALSRGEAEQRQPSAKLLRLLATLYRETGQLAQAEATDVRLHECQQEEMAAIRQALESTLPPVANRPSAPRPHPEQPSQEISAAATVGELLTDATAPTPAECARLDEALRRHFPHDRFRPGQAEVIATILRRESVLAVMPTGAGKSLCYQLAALLLPGTTLIISPLIALMKDQLDGLPPSVATQATTLNSSLDGTELEARLAQATAGGYKLIYAAPERLRQRPFLHALKRAGVSLLVVDEAHCVSLWGHDFRPDYLFITKAWHELEEPPILAMTATATPRVRDDIRAALGHTHLIAADIQRPNLRLEAHRLVNDREKQDVLVDLCREMDGSGIVYATARQKCEELAALLRSHGLSAIHYHAGIGDRAETQDRFMNDQARIVVATIAFGMGVDKADIRFVIHYDPPQSLESYYQEAGRAGRDGLPSRCVLFHTPADKGKWTRRARQQALDVDLMRRVYSAIQARLGSQGSGLVATADLERDLAADPTPIRVAVHFLEAAGLLWRGFDLPRTAMLTLLSPTAIADPQCSCFVQAARLRFQQTVSRDLLALSQETSLDPRTIEALLLAWDDAGWLRYRGIGRDMLLALPNPPPDSRQRVAAMLADHAAGQEGRIAEMMSYAQTSRCRHGYISAYFGGRRIDGCPACDNCTGQQDRPGSRPVPTRVTRPAVAGPVGDPARIILQSVAQLPFPLGRTGLARALTGLSTSPVQADRFPLFGALANHSRKYIGEMAALLVEQGLLEYKEKAGYQLLCLTDKGKAWLDAAGSNTPPVAASASPLDSNCPEHYDNSVFEALRTWRLKKAQEIAKPPFVVMHDTTLKAIAASMPATLGELAAIRGIGPHKLEQYGAEILEIMAGYSTAAHAR